MKSKISRTLLLLCAVLLLAGAWRLACGDDWDGWPRRLTSGALLAGVLAAVCTLSFRRVRREDRIARLEAQLCCEQGENNRADEALAEADLLLARLTIRRADDLGGDEVVAEAKLDRQLARIQTELAQLQQQTALDAACSARLERVRARLEQVARIVRSTARSTTRTVEPG
jgi:multidrug efflux pump subunit AcrA (membrane-fusion protein)